MSSSNSVKSVNGVSADSTSTGLCGVRGPRRKPIACLLRTTIMGVLLCFLKTAGHSTVNVSLAPTVPVSVQDDFLAVATTYFQGSVVKDPYFANTYKITISGKKVVPPQNQPICDLDKDVALMVQQSTWSYVYGFANGMDSERFQIEQLLRQMQAQDFSTHSCFGVPVSSISITTSSVQDLCLGSYNVDISSISQRWGYIFSPTGGN